MERLSSDDISQLRNISPSGVHIDVSLAILSRWRIGGTAALLLRPNSIDELVKLRAWLFYRNISPVVIGETSNLLFDDRGLLVPCIQVARRISRFQLSENTIDVEAGLSAPWLARLAMKAGLTGIEHICGIPGTVGGLVFMNGGSQRKGIGSAVSGVETITECGAIKKYTASECSFDYRVSNFQSSGEIISKIQLHLDSGERSTIRKNMLQILSDRRVKFPRKLPNCGSVFKSNPANYDLFGSPGEIIEKLKLKGERSGGAQISNVHANFIVNTASASASDVLDLIRRVKVLASERMGINLEAEAIYVRHDGICIPVDEV